MAYLDDDEIIATIRHEMRLEDEEGRCNDVLPAVFRRGKNGGLPLDFRSVKRGEEDDEDGRHSPGYTIPIEEEVSSTKELIATRLRSRTTDSDQLNDELRERERNALCSLEAEKHLYAERSPAEIERRLKERIERQEREKSSLARELEAAAACPAGGGGPERQFRPFAAHDASEMGSSVQSKRVLIVYAIPEAENNNGEMPTIMITIKSSATIADLIGLACYKFAEKEGVAPSAPLDSLQLYIAEESGEIDDEFPPMEAHKQMAEIGFTVLALKAGDRGSARSSALSATVFIPGKEGIKFDIDLPNLQQTLRWIRDEAVKRKLEKTNTSEEKIASLVNQYNLELVDKPSAPLELDKTVGGTLTTEFVLIRRNCSRGDWHPRGMGFSGYDRSGGDQPPPTPGTAMMGGGGFDFFPMACSASVRPMSTVANDDTTMASFNVDRMHKYKNKWPANLVLRWNWIEVTPVHTDRRLSNRFQGGGQKSNMIAWEDLADARIRERRNPSGGLSIVTLSITWLPAPGVAQTPTTPLRKSSTIYETSPPSSAPLSMGGTQTLHDIVARYKENEKWKVLNLEMLSYSEGDKAVKMLNDGIKQRNSSVCQAYQHSAGGDLRPGAAADAALNFQRSLRQARPNRVGSSNAAPQRVERKRSSIAQFTSGLGRMFNRD